MNETPNPALEQQRQNYLIAAVTAIQESPAAEPAAPPDPAAAARQARKDQTLLTGQAALALLDRYQQELLQIYPELKDRIYGEDALPVGSPTELLVVYEDLEAVKQGIGAIEEIRTWLHPRP